ncbi:DUF805 domain-containing protein [Acinetobacter baylyi]|uniref:DUF805 domain-containing protein n=1 Tax=Acinetobacter baylyi TaxID=202950 RepID=UPI000EA16593|nr:DUF805 domain-containing protein [Acinetobacter baylyi]
MKGIILDFSIQTNTGIISGDDSVRYHFLGSEWKETIAPQRGTQVDFDLNNEGQVIGVYKALNHSTSSILNTSPTYEKSEDQYNLFDWFLKCLKNYANFDGRARRKEYWFFRLGMLILVIMASLIDTILETDVIFTGLVLLASLIPDLAVSVRRLHDTGKSGWWFLISLIPIIGMILLIIWFARDGQSEHNQYGKPVK